VGGNIGNNGFTFFTQIDRDRLMDELSTFCALMKYNLKANLWIGIGIDILDQKYFAHEIICIDSEWKYDRRVEKTVKWAIKKGLIQSGEGMP
jgi:hypothetical protein